MYVFVSDAYVKDYTGGAELSTQGLMSGCYSPIVSLYSSQVTPEIIHSLKDYHWVFTNTSHMPKKCYLEAIKTLSYSVVEYDYKFCSMRSIEKHKSVEGECRCESSSFGKLFAVFLAKASSVFWMSKLQSEKYFSRFPVLRTKSNYVLSSIFNEELLENLKTLRSNIETKKESYLILGSPSWIKGTEDAIEYAQNNHIQYEVVHGLEYNQMLKKISEHKGLIFLPKGSDTCPRLVIEAALLDCDLILNDNVQHKNEEWFRDLDIERMTKYLNGRSEYFWSVLNANTKADLVPKPTNVSEENKYLFIVPVFESEQWIGKTIESIKNQHVKSWRCFIGDDKSGDKTGSKVKEAIEEDKRFVFRKNTQKKYALKNINDLIEEANPDDEEIIIILDGDDWLTNEHVLDTLNKYYDDGSLVTYGSFIEYPTGRIGQESTKYSADVIEKNTFRSDLWRASHLKTLKYKVWKKIEKKDFLNSRGEYFQSSYDQAIMLPALEMCGKKSAYVKEVLCVYNIGNPNAVNKVSQTRQHDNMLEIRSKDKYDQHSFT
tara:strand:- start:3158 stop:4792 length:1635 start_codon:yes stop_codon:yes gene_type:complete